MYYICVQKCEWQERKDGRQALYLCYPRIFPPPILRLFFFLILVIHRFLSCLRKRVFHRCACGRGCREPSRRLRLVCAPSLPLHCKYIMPQTHCNCTECWSSSLFLFSLCYWRHKSCGGKKVLYDFVFLRLAPVVGLFFFFACPLWWEHFTFAATQCWLSFPSQSCLLLLLPLYIERVTPSFIFYFFFLPYLSPVWERRESLKPPQFIHAYGGRRALVWIALAL